jgi:hypothetical protein
MLALLLAAADPCALPRPAAAQDPATAQAYLEVAESEAGRPAALEALREALRLDPGNARAQAAFQAACRAGDDRFERARARMDAGDRAAAIALFEQIRADGPSPPAALLEGICLYELDQDAAAETLLLEAAGDEQTADPARFYLGLLARRRGEQAEAERLFASVAQGGSSVASQAQRVLRESRGEELAAVSLIAESGYDSNVSLSPSTAPLGGTGLGSLAAALLLKPVSGMFVRASGYYRAQPALPDYNLGALGGAVGYALRSGPRQLAAEYDYDFVALGNAPYLPANRLALSGWWEVGAVSLGAAYAVRFENYRTSVTNPFSGTAHRPQLSALFHLGGTAWAEIGYHLERDLAAYPETSYLEHGPSAGLRLSSGRWRAAAQASAAFRGYDAVDPELGVQRKDVLLDADLLGEYDLAPRWTLRLVVGGHDDISNVSALSYLRGYVTLGAAFAAGL